MVGEVLRIALPARPENVARIREEVTAHAADLGMDPQRLLDLKTVVSEACGNVVRYAYDEDERGGTVEVLLSTAGAELELLVRDHGRGISPREESAYPGLGLGLPLIGGLSSRMQLDSRLGEGTELRVAIPITVSER